jgi:hypothetical protein
MKTKLKPLLTLFIFIAHFAVWGQEQILFEPLMKKDTIYSKQLVIEDFEKMFWCSKDSTKYVFESKNGEVLLVKRGKGFWITFRIDLENSSDVEVSEKEQFLFVSTRWGNGGGGRGFTDTKYFTVIIDLTLLTISEFLITSSSVDSWEYDDRDNDVVNRYYTSDCDSEISVKNNVMLVNTFHKSHDDLREENRIVISYNTDDCECSLSSGEYHYINGNFVKVKSYINQHHFAHSVFDMGEKSALTPECTFYFECDCCANQLVFDSDSTFVVVAPCTQDVSVSYGNYEVKDNQLYLHYSGKWTERYIVSDEPNKAPEYAYRDTLVPAHTEVFTPEVCKTTTLFTEQSNANIKLLRSQQSKEEQLEYLKEVGLLDKLKK